MHASDNATGMLNKFKEMQLRGNAGFALGATALTCLGAWKLNHWQYDYRYRNGDMEHKQQKMLALVPRLGGSLMKVHSEKRSNPENAHTFEPYSFAVKQSLWDSPALQVTVAPSQKASEDSKEYSGGVTITIAHLLKKDQTTVIKSIFDTEARDRLDELRKVGVALSTVENIQGGFARLLASGISSTCWIHESHSHPSGAVLGLSSADYATILADSLDDTEIKERLRRGQAVLSDNPLIKVEQTCTPDGKQATLRLTDMVSGNLINFVIHKASIFNALKRLELGWSRSSYAPIENSIGDVVATYATSDSRYYWNNVRFSIADKITAASQEPATQWILLTHDEKSKGKLVWSMSPPAHINLLPEDALNSALTTFLSSDILHKKKFKGKRKYIVDVQEFTRESNPAHGLSQLVSLKIQQTGELAERVITVDSNNVCTDYKITMQKGWSAAEQLANETLRSQITAAIANTHERHRNGISMNITGEFELRLHEEGGGLWYRVCNQEGKRLWQTELFSLASSSNAGSSAQPDEDMPRGAGWVGCGFMLPQDAYIYRSDDDTETEDEDYMEPQGSGWVTCHGLFDDLSD
jgi:hypothetical protein